MKDAKTVLETYLEHLIKPPRKRKPPNEEDLIRPVEYLIPENEMLGEFKSLPTNTMINLWLSDQANDPAGATAKGGKGKGQQKK